MNRILVLHEFDNHLTRGVVCVLEQGVSLLRQIDDALYTADGRGSVGGHIRHCLDFVNCFLAGTQSGEIDYNRRERDEITQNSRAYAAAQIQKAIARLRALPAAECDKRVSVKLEAREGWCESSVLREIEYLQSHTTHHFALVALKLQQKGFEVEPDFGVAVSTLQYWQQNSRAEKAA